MPKSRHTRTGKPRAARRSRQRDRNGAPSPVRRVLAVDPAVEIIAEAAARLWPPMAGVVLGEVMAGAPQNVRRDGERLDGEISGVALNAIRSVAESLAQREACSHDGWEWLYYLRRLPGGLFQGHLTTTAPYDETLPVALSATSTATADLPAVYGAATPARDDNALRSVFRLAAFAILLSQVHSKIRRAGKGQAFILRSDQLPESVSDPDLDDAIQLYDQRWEADLETALPAGTDVLTFPVSDTESWPLLMAGTMRRTPGRQVALGWEGPLIGRNLINVQGRYGPAWMTVERLAGLAALGRGQATQWWDPALPSLIAFLRALSFDVIMRSSTAGLNLPRTGYLIMARGTLLQLLDDIRDEATKDIPRLLPGAQIPATGSEILSFVEGIHASAWPLLPGPIIRPAGQQVVIDLLSVAPRLVRMLTIPGSSPSANDRGTHFELTVQEVIDSTPWRPPGPLRDVRGRSLRWQGTDITDIDAIGMKTALCCWSPARAFRTAATTTPGAIGWSAMPVPCWRTLKRTGMQSSGDSGITHPGITMTSQAATASKARSLRRMSCSSTAARSLKRHSAAPATSCGPSAVSGSCGDFFLPDRLP